MAQQSVIKRSVAAAGANTITALITPAPGVKCKILGFWIVNEVAAQAAGMTFELRVGTNPIAVLGLDIAAAPVGQTSKQLILSHEFIGDGVNAINAVNLVALAATSIAVYNLIFDANY